MKTFFRLFAVCFAAFTAAVLFSVTAFAVCDNHRMDGGVITEQPTCERIGIITTSCLNEGCDYSYVEKMGNLGHRYENGICLNCGETDETYIPEKKPEEVVPEVSTPAEAPDTSSAAVPMEWEPPFVNPTISAPESITLAAPSTSLTVVQTTASEPSSLFLVIGMAMIFLSAAAVFLFVRKTEYAHH